MKSLDRLKEFVYEDDVLAEMAEDIEDEVAELQESWAQEAREHADDSARLAELAHEIAESYMKLPVDADGVPIHVGDVLESEEYCDLPFQCMGLNVEACKSGNRWTVCMNYDSYSGTSEYTPASRCHHVKPRTIEDVLLDVIEHAVCPSNSWDEIIAKYANEIRELMGVS